MTVHNSTRCAGLVQRAKALIAADSRNAFSFPDMHAVDLALRLCAPGPRAGAVSASECHGITEMMIAAYDHDAFPAQAREIIAELAAQLEAADAEIARLRKAAPQRYSVADGVALRAAIMQEVARETGRELDPVAYLAVANRVAECVVPPDTLALAAERDALRAELAAVSAKMRAVVEAEE